MFAHSDAGSSRLSVLFSFWYYSWEEQALTTCSGSVVFRERFFVREKHENSLQNCANCRLILEYNGLWIDRVRQLLKINRCTLRCWITLGAVAPKFSFLRRVWFQQDGALYRNYARLAQEQVWWQVYRGSPQSSDFLPMDNWLWGRMESFMKQMNPQRISVLETAFIHWIE